MAIEVTILSVSDILIDVGFLLMMWVCYFLTGVDAVLINVITSWCLTTQYRIMERLAELRLETMQLRARVYDLEPHNAVDVDLH